ncbi:cytochrome-c oxidase, cbb3-type subunit III [Gallaecimonas xiamenensis]|uniref:Cbb3-type cytochrome c oxidase subunit n=1 Tax=Gallaecimonas xiamenensis 3-C-1 TaxID=745411 RepID=K2J1G9_9GAMM|nr:cytochrome-c oxidase, cbb3-type subunit III [Gallaecimonas xiamenensis]EKE76801.1 cytochrome c oxidase, cbb3-type subunit III [Gallaecimonas xiamenensis 3-C-1]
MSSFWSIWIIVLTLIVIIGCAVVLFWARRNSTDIKEGELMHHSFDGIVEINNPLPRWWYYMFWFTIVFSLLYLLLMPGLGSFKGLLGWQSSIQDARSLAEIKEKEAKLLASGSGYIQYEREMTKAEATFGPIFAAYASRPIEELAYDKDALKVGQRLFLQNCAQCHGSAAKGGNGFPNLTDSDWLYGGKPEIIKETLLHGRVAQMPAWGDALGEQGVKEMTAYVLSLSGRKVNQQLADAGKAKFAMCAACHGQDGKGAYLNNLPVAAGAAPNLTDDIWLYGGSERAVEETLRYGRHGVMPAWQDRLGADKVHVLAAYVYRLSNPEPKEQE